MSEAERGPSPEVQPPRPGLLPPPRLGAPRAPPPSHGGAVSSIQHLGAEIHLIRDMMDPVHMGGLYDFLLTALEVRDRNVRVPGAGAFPAPATVVGVSSLTFTMCVPPRDGSPLSPGLPLSKGLEGSCGGPGGAGERAGQWRQPRPSPPVLLRAPAEGRHASTAQLLGLQGALVARLLRDKPWS